jgi:heat shock protein 1/8
MRSNACIHFFHQMIWIAFLLPSQAHQLFSFPSIRLGRLATHLSSVINSVGIDLGTTCSLVSVVKGGLPLILSIDDSRTLPSVVSYRKSGDILVGKPAQELQASDPLNTFASIKRLVGRTMKEAKDTGDMDLFKKQLVPTYCANISEEVCGLRCNYATLPDSQGVLLPEQILAEVLKKLLKSASQHFKGEDIHNAVITVPAYFNSQQQAKIEQAGYMAGLNKIRLLKEPEAAALAYGLNIQEAQLILVFDLGGGTFDVSILEVGDGFVEVIATSGDGHLGGDDFDAAIMEWIFKHLITTVSKDVVDKMKSNPIVRSHLLQIATTSKISLSTAKNVTICLEDTFRVASKEKIITKETLDTLTLAPLCLTRGAFERQCKDLLQRLLKPVRVAALMAGVNLPGESGRISISDDDVDEDEIDAEEEEEEEDSKETGVSLNMKELEVMQKLGRMEAKRRQKVKGQTNREMRRLQKSYGDNTLSLFPSGQALDDVILVGGATRMPCIAQLVRTLTHIDPKRNIHPDEAVCLGAGVLSGVLDGKIQDMKVLSAWQAAVVRALYTEGEDNTLMTSEFANQVKKIEDKPAAPKKKAVKFKSLIAKKRKP